ncbi:IclR family transcriptional regulator [Alcaligenes endophyticus]|uniref:Helix-turn-helix domain-containing protein n=1 Tax=Alcaligenes endophyticus TaxID=1929088 RepID=A0ABT8EF96_9BURK|nr:IclR family transcriptional regulator C-terminal domain-containing protein [Alcaligenes endophyticus]MCX5590454.1 helix-turn-helix domain-containing protein [Alcaligenes endophyticus]MDN4119882.1 helix-turn-helix domain-containing protein [Alcaligenes endophyticus]
MSTNLVPAAARAMALFEVFAREKRPLSNSELARLLSLPESSCSDLVHTLLQCGFLRRTVKSRKLYPTERLQTIARQIGATDPVLSSLQEACELLRDRTGESILCGRVLNGVVQVIVFSDGRHPLRYTGAGSDKLSLHVSALGKAILAYGSPEEALRQLQLRPLRKVASGTRTDLGQLQEQIALFRRQGWAWVENEGGEDLAALAVAGAIGDEVLALAIVGPVGRLSLHQSEYVQALKLMQAQIFDV